MLMGSVIGALVYSTVSAGVASVRRADQDASHILLYAEHLTLP
jgi:hypothetical protein